MTQTGNPGIETEVDSPENSTTTAIIITMEETSEGTATSNKAGMMNFQIATEI